MSGEHPCPIRGCGAQVPIHLLMCPRHWRMVRPSLKRSLYRAWDRGMGRGTQAHMLAMRQCVDNVHTQLEQEATDGQGHQPDPR